MLLSMICADACCSRVMALMSKTVFYQRIQYDPTSRDTVNHEGIQYRYVMQGMLRLEFHLDLLYGEVKQWLPEVLYASAL